jgi:hypothetical protein
MKTCSRCREAKPVTEFGKRSAARDGLQSWCKPCVLEYHREQHGGRCQIDGCDADAQPYMPMCRMHDMRQRRNGDPHKTLVAQGHRGDTPEPDPAPARALREALEQQRRLRNGWRWAWSTARTTALLTIAARGERMSWEVVFVSTASAWRSAYEGEPQEKPDPFAMLMPAVDDRDPWPQRQHPVLTG